jgi:hypothetical protein
LSAVKLVIAQMVAALSAALGREAGYMPSSYAGNRGLAPGPI